MAEIALFSAWKIRLHQFAKAGVHKPTPPTNPNHHYLSNRYHPGWHCGWCIRRGTRWGERAIRRGEIPFSAPYGGTICVGILVVSNA
ncbi:MAG TPA: hypothetical protein VNM72_14595 [Blastocatellia bacterium]|nr:hypothetical protein [Blastocatellia bacterium]